MKLKDHKSFDKQIEILKKIGLVINNQEHFINKEYNKNFLLNLEKRN